MKILNIIGKCVIGIFIAIGVIGSSVVLGSLVASFWKYASDATYFSIMYATVVIFLVTFVLALIYKK